jgi:hypothetical protein
MAAEQIRAGLGLQVWIAKLPTVSAPAPGAAMQRHAHIRMTLPMPRSPLCAGAAAHSVARLAWLADRRQRGPPTWT